MILITLVLWVKKGKKEVLTYKKSYIRLIRIKEEKKYNQLKLTVTALWNV